MISIIIRTKNEERWITPCLMGVFKQDYKDFEVILVDNLSTDKTIEKALQFNITKVIACEDFRPGLALNMGIRESKGEYIVCLSGHCIPVNEKWLSNLMRNFNDEEVAGAYGRQEPLAFTSDSDKRDLSIIFGLDRRTQKKDSFFHNANSMLRRKLWEEHPFDETLSNIEDRVWAETVLHKGYKIVYEPRASVYHYHGIYHQGNEERCANIVRILETLKPETKKNDYLDIDKLNIIAVIPVKGENDFLGDKPLIGYTIEQALQSKYINRVLVSTDSPELAKLSEELGASAPFLREESLSEDFVDAGKVLQYSMERMDDLKIFPDIIVYLEITFPFRTKQLIDDMVIQLVKNGFDSVLAVRRESRSIWSEKDGRIERVDKGDIPRKYKEPCFIGLKGLCCVTHSEFVREGSLLGGRIGVYEVSNPYSHIEVRGKEDIVLAEKIIEGWDKVKS
ncbi:MAG: glycosyltransferase family 2 protein [Candidatus Scalindua sp.]|nr:glycosyltransferase family 2 protein [Candidatus Scalindua sp.]MBT6049148.1 glycosyltransferase family 2 protein [Candidatus Scalindua sp.]MBT6230846.1 glycosyltransferase family 2 protein [Candidatus Scalindua sp.]MBT6563463.1 glycosyltransferase family 2 protein [Candidatus Scalindua sp.]